MRNTSSRLTTPYYILACAVLAGAARAQLGRPFFEPRLYDINEAPQDVALGDFDADGLFDWVAPTGYSNHLVVGFGDGLGGFDTSTLPSGPFPDSVAVADFDGDGDSDIAVTEKNNDRTRVCLSDGSGGFLAQSIYSTGDWPHGINAGDFDGDGDQDLVVAGTASDSVVRLGNDGAGAFTVLPNDVAIGVSPRRVLLVDVNGDNQLDLVVTLQGPDQIAVALGDGSGNFAVPATFQLVDQPQGIAVADLNADGKKDLAVAGFNSESITLLFGDGLGSFGSPTTTLDVAGPLGVGITDINSDGKVDLVSTSKGGTGFLTCWIGDGAGGFTARPAQTIGNSPNTIAFGDFNGDGRLDAMVSDGGLGRVGAHMGNGLGDFGEPRSVSTAGNLRVALARDLDLDGRVDLAVAQGHFAAIPKVLLFAGRGAGHFEEQPGILGLYNSLAADDLDADGQIDLVAGDGVAGNVTVLRGAGGFAYAAPQSYPALAGCFAVTLADVNGDNERDAVVLGASPAQVGLLLGDGLGGFGPVNAFAVPADPGDVDLTDLDGDGDLDVVVSSTTAGQVARLLNDGTGQLGAAQTASTGNGGAQGGFVLADLNEDGFEDLVCVVPGNNAVRVLLCDGLGGFGPSTTFVCIGGPRSIAKGDFNGDDDLDVAVTGENYRFVAVFLGNGTGTLAAGQWFLGPLARALVCADFDSDGFDDLAIADPTSLAVLLNRSACAPIAYCTAGTTSNGCQPTLASSGMPSVSATSGFVITLSRTEGQKQGLFFYGLSGRKESPWSPGSASFLCVKSPVQRTSAQGSGGTSGACDGSYSLDLASYWATHATALGQPLNPGATIDVQAWFRDPAAPATTNLSGGLEFVSCP